MVRLHRSSGRRSYIFDKCSKPLEMMMAAFEEESTAKAKAALHLVEQCAAAPKKQPHETRLHLDV